MAPTRVLIRDEELGAISDYDDSLSGKRSKDIRSSTVIDTLIEQGMNGTSVAEIFVHHRDSFFRGKETDALNKLSLMKYMHKGISIWLDVPLEALAHKIAAVGTNSRPLLHDDSGDACTVAFKHLLSIWDERGEAYTNANARVSLENIAAKCGYKDVSDLTPTEIGIGAFEQVQSFLDKEETMEIPEQKEAVKGRTGFIGDEVSLTFFLLCFL
ncbi:unnamed protein product [Microthlaspi erraticum]|uniref:Uncharacterized protein n=1 Tax=Microthlaspi erraticum TaxID=1685480 RepID=A0A6D2LCY8_9BRAS|nr:unnamed protein product [Microthlaspi erraticum]